MTSKLPLVSKSSQAAVVPFSQRAKNEASCRAERHRGDDWIAAELCFVVRVVAHRVNTVTG
jgi:hypothetical protein